jgi:hypothetical protein
MCPLYVAVINFELSVASYQFTTHIFGGLLYNRFDSELIADN